MLPPAPHPGFFHHGVGFHSVISRGVIPNTNTAVLFQSYWVTYGQSVHHVGIDDLTACYVRCFRSLSRWAAVAVPFPNAIQHPEYAFRFEIAIQS